MTQITATRKRIQTNASGRGGDGIMIKITNYPAYIHTILVKVESKGPDWQLYRTFKNDEDVKDTNIMLSIGYKDEPINVIILDRENNWRQISFREVDGLQVVGCPKELY